MDLNNLPPIKSVKRISEPKQKPSLTEVLIYCSMFGTGLLFGTSIVLMLTSLAPVLAKMANL